MKQHQISIFIALLMLFAVLFLVFFPIHAQAAQRYEVLQIGDKDEYVIALQERLAQLGYFSGNATGYFGTVTQQAVMDYQEKHGLTVDGKAGPITLRAIMGKDFTLPSGRFENKSPQDSEDIKPGDKGSAVKLIQQRLKELGYYEYGTITGYYGPVTYKAVKRFQSTNGLRVDGIVGPETIRTLNSKSVKFYCLCPGDKGQNVSRMQQRLAELGYFNSKVTGYFGAITATSIREFQAQNGLVIDALAGQDTLKLLYSPDAPEWDKINRVKAPLDKDSTSVEKMLSFANDQIGKPYVYATEGPASFDCSGFIYYVLKYMGVSTARYSAEGFSKVDRWIKVSDMGALIPGDLVFFTSETSSRVTHAGIYLGDNDFIHASSANGCVTVSSLTNDTTREFYMARRIF